MANPKKAQKSAQTLAELEPQIASALKLVTTLQLTLAKLRAEDVLATHLLTRALIENGALTENDLDESAEFFRAQLGVKRLGSADELIDRAHDDFRLKRRGAK